MAKKSYSVEERQQIRQALLEIGRQLFSQQGCRHTTLPQIYEQVGISKTFFLQLLFFQRRIYRTSAVLSAAEAACVCAVFDGGS